MGPHLLNLLQDGPEFQCPQEPGRTKYKYFSALVPKDCLQTMFQGQWALYRMEEKKKKAKQIKPKHTHKKNMTTWQPTIGKKK